MREVHDLHRKAARRIVVAPLPVVLSRGVVEFAAPIAVGVGALISLDLAAC